jgi:hypothetical protein
VYLFSLTSHSLAAVCGGRSYGESNEGIRSGNIRHLAIFISMALMVCIAALLQLSNRGNKMDTCFFIGGSFSDYDIFVVIVIIFIIIIIIKLNCSNASHRGVWVSGILDPLFLNVSTRWWLVVSISTPAALPPWAVFLISIN